jgi:immunity protein 74 of polymorphic toxin system
VIVFITRGHIDLEVAGRAISVQGEALFRSQENSTDFVVYKSMIKNWGDGGVVSDADLAVIIDDLCESAMERGIVLDFE